MAQANAGEIVVGPDSPATPKRSTRLVRPTAKAKSATKTNDEAPPITRKVSARTTRSSSTETDLESRDDGNYESETSNKDVLLKVLKELQEIKLASEQQQNLICGLQVQLEETRQELRETKEELKNAQEQLETLTIATTAQSSLRASYAEVACTPPGSQLSNIRSLSTDNTSPSNQSDALYCTVDITKVEVEKRDGISAGTIRSLIESEVCTRLGKPDWRCRAVTLDRKSPLRIRISCRNEAEHKLVKQAAESQVPQGARILRDELYPVKVDNVNRLAVLDDATQIRTGAAEAFGKENEVQVAKVSWLSRRDSPKAYGSMVVYLTKTSDAKKVLNEGFFYAGGKSGYTSRFEHQPRPEQCYNCQQLGHKAFQCSKTQVCANCTKEEHHYSGCKDTMLKCALCSRLYEAFNRNCRQLFPLQHE